MPLSSIIANISLTKRRKPLPLAEILLNENQLASPPATLLNQTQELVNTTIIKRRTKPLLAEILLNKKPKTVAVNYSKQTTFLTQVRQLFHDLFSDTRQDYQQALTTSYDVIAEQATERELKRNLMIAVVGFGFATAGVLISPLFYLPSIGCALYNCRMYIEDGYQALVEERRLNYKILLALTIPATLVSGFIWAAALGITLGRINFYLVAKTENRSKQNIADLFGGQARTVWLLVGKIEVETPIEQVREGDIVVVQAGEMIAVDGLITSGNATIDQHTLTGEAQPIEKGEGDIVLASTMVLTGRLCIRVEKAGQATVAAKITHLLNQTTDFKQTLQSRTDRFLNQMVLPMTTLSALTLPIAGVGGALAVLWYYPGFRMIVFGPLSMLSYLQVAAQKKILVKDGRALEMLDEVNTVVFDKTGTLTLEQPTVSRILSYNGLTEEAVLRYAAAAEIKQSHPIALAIIQAAIEQKLDLPPLVNAEYKVGYGLKVMLESRTVWVGSLRFMTLEGIAIPAEVAIQQTASHSVGHSLILVALDGQVVGAIELQPTIRPEAKEVVYTLQKRGLKTIIISGDSEAPTRQLATSLGIDHYFAEVLPEDKAKLVEQLQAEDRKVCFVGDGINDSIALKTADVSVSLRGATTIATDMAQIVFMDGTLAQLPTLFDLADEFAANMRFNFLAAILPSVVGIMGTLVFAWGMTLCVFLIQVSTPVGIYNALKPLLNDDNHQVKLLP